jgi:uncharacterized protein DUF6719
VKRIIVPNIKLSPTRVVSLLIIAGLAIAAVPNVARAEQVSREQDIVNLRLGQRILVDDGSCPAGQIKEVSGTKMTASGILRAQKCIPRIGPRR